MAILRGESGVSRRFAAFILFIVAAITPWLTVAQTTQPAPTSEQLEVFRNLPPDQQRAVLDAMASGRGKIQQRTDVPLDPTPEGAIQPAPVEPEPVNTGPPRIGITSSVLIDVKIEEAETPQVMDEKIRATMVSRRDRILAGNPYRMNEGRLQLPFMPPILLAGLTAEEATRLLNADPRLDGFEFEVVILPIEPVGTEALKPFGYDIFQQPTSTFAPATDIPVPPDYRMGPGDNVVVQLYGKRNASYSLVVDRAGQLNLPDFGPIPVTGLTFDQVREAIEQRVNAEMIGVNANVTMGQLRSIRVFVLGDVARPGSYTVSGLATVTHALFASGGVSEIGSLRNVELKRAGTTVARLDLYDLLLKGDSSNDQRLQSGDVVFVHPVGSTAAISGQVRRPAIYELKPNATVADLLQLAGGLAPDADPRVATLERVTADHERVVLNVDLTSASGLEMTLRAGDVLVVPRVLEDFTRGVELTGHVQRPGRYAWREGMRLSDLLGSYNAFKLNADQRYILIRREHASGRRLEVLSADATRALSERGSDADPLLQSRDRIIVFSMQSDRGTVLDELLRELRLQARDNNPPPIVSISGHVRAPGQYPLEPGMTVADLIRAGGGLDEAAYALEAELTRFNVGANDARETQVINLRLSDVLNNPGRSDLKLKAYDTLVIKETPDWSEQGTIRLLGEVRFPGEYPIRKGETLSSVIRRAGGLTEYAFVEGAVFTRQEIREQERLQIENLANRLQNDLALVALQGAQANTGRADPSEALAVGQSLLTQLRNSTPTGRLIVDVNQALKAEGSDQDIQLRNGDMLLIPPQRQYVAVLGEVQNPTSHVWRRGLTRDDYLSLSGGPTDKAASKRIYVVRANGSVVGVNNSRRWFSSSDVDIRPGDTIVVPLDTEKMRPLPLWTAVTTIIYNLAVSVAAVGSL